MKFDPERVKEIAALLPAQPQPVLLVPITDRVAWDGLSADIKRQVLDEGEKQLKTGMIPFSDKDYLAYTKSGKRVDKMQVFRNDFIRAMLLAECVENKGRFLPALEEGIASMATDKSWTFSGHDPKLDNYAGRKFEIDLSVAARALTFSAVYAMMGDRISALTKQIIRDQLERHVFDAYRKRFVTGIDRLYWMTGDNNWNAVCYAGVVLAALSVIDSAEERALFVHGAEIGTRYYLDSMPQGYSPEGIHYWSYGFGNYVLLASGIRQATDGKIDWFPKCEGCRQQPLWPAHGTHQ